MKIGKLVLAAALWAATFGGASAQTTEPQIGQAFGAWVFQCSAVGQDKTICSFGTTVLSPDKKQAMVDLRISHPKVDGALILSALLPLGLNIQSGVKTAIDGGESIAVPLRTCVARGCVATMELDADAVKKWKAGKSLALEFEIAGKKITATIKLDGITDAFTAAKW